ncbi:hypothetical protein CDL12_21894 [Handroanthus impetiginosus]|uniref:Uncharacterized protein n=1 Tax=Handroanthus impetiginosus TaxID=429701 RepID=A0A2G9GK30_9LAMI|nr:hypothetical protein CDL12_21894 [Handroanthus impetiginosus]
MQVTLYILHSIYGRCVDACKCEDCMDSLRVVGVGVFFRNSYVWAQNHVWTCGGFRNANVRFRIYFL